MAGGMEYRSEDFIQNEDPNSRYGNVADYQFRLAPSAGPKSSDWHRRSIQAGLYTDGHGE